MSPDTDWITMPLCARTGPVLGRCCQHQPRTGPLLACLQGCYFSDTWISGAGFYLDEARLDDAVSSDPDTCKLTCEDNPDCVAFDHIEGECHFRAISWFSPDFRYDRMQLNTSGSYTHYFICRLQGNSVYFRIQLWLWVLCLKTQAKSMFIHVNILVFAPLEQPCRVEF